MSNFTWLFWDHLVETLHHTQGSCNGWLCASVCERDFAICSSRLRYMKYRVQHVNIQMDKIHMIYNYAKASDMKTQSIRKDRVFVVSREKLNVLMHSIQHLSIYNTCNHMLNIVDLNIYVYQKNTFNQVFWSLVTCTHF